MQFIAAAIAAPRLMILDEPFSGLDPASAESLREAVIDLRRNGTTAILSTDDMRKAETAEIEDEYGNDTIRVFACSGGEGVMKTGTWISGT